MEEIHNLWPTLFTTFFILSSMAEGGGDQRQSLVGFMAKLSPNDNLGWNLNSDPCTDNWKGVTCDPSQPIIYKVVLERLNLNGTFDPESLCSVTSVSVVSLEGNNLKGAIPKEISKCKHLSHLYLGSNQLSGELPRSILQLKSLKRMDLSNNNFTGKLPQLEQISGILSLLINNNRFSGPLPELDFARLDEFNVSNNELSGPIPDVQGHFKMDSFLGNPLLCGKPLPNECPPSNSLKSRNAWSTDRFLIYLGYAFIALVVAILIVLVIVKKRRSKKVSDVKKMEEGDKTNNRSSGFASTEFKTPEGEYRSEFSITTSMESGVGPPALVVLEGHSMKDLSFDGLLGAPAELLGRGKRGTLYKVMVDDGKTLVVKRIRERGISSEEFKWRMKKISGVKHRNVLAPLAFYCSKQEKLVVYEYQPNGSLFKLLHGTQESQIFDWGSRLTAAASIAEAVAFAHKELWEDGIAHGNLKSTNILFDKKMNLSVSEYGITIIEQQQDKSQDTINDSSFEGDTYAFGVILLELLTGKTVENNGLDLTRWVNLVVREEWTAEVFDRVLVFEGVNEERLVNLLHIALKCISPPVQRPRMSEVAAMINVLKEEDERSLLISEPPSTVFLAPKETSVSENIKA